MRLLVSVTLFLGLLWPVCSNSKPTPFPKGKHSPIVFYHVAEHSLSKQEMECLMRNVYYEARGEGFAGMVGVAQVTLNRHHVRYMGKTSLCGVVHAPNQFSWTKKRQAHPQGESWRQAQHIALLVLKGLRIRGLEQTLHFSHRTLTPRWSQRMVISLYIGRHHYWAIPT